MSFFLVNCIVFNCKNKATVDFGIDRTWHFIYKHINKNTKPPTFLK